MTTQVIRGSNQEIAQAVARLSEKVIEAILLLESPNATPESPEALTDEQFETLLKEMDANAVSVGGVDFRARPFTRVKRVNDSSGHLLGRMTDKMVAAMKTHHITRLLTFNTADFSKLPVILIHPAAL